MSEPTSTLAVPSLSFWVPQESLKVMRLFKTFALKQRKFQVHWILFCVQIYSSIQCFPCLLLRNPKPVGSLSDCCPLFTNIAVPILCCFLKIGFSTISYLGKGIWPSNAREESLGWSSGKIYGGISKYVEGSTGAAARMLEANKDQSNMNMMPKDKLWEKRVVVKNPQLFKIVGLIIDVSLKSLGNPVDGNGFFQEMILNDEKEGQRDQELVKRWEIQHMSCFSAKVRSDLSALFSLRGHSHLGRLIFTVWPRKTILWRTARTTMIMNEFCSLLRTVFWRRRRRLLKIPNVHSITTLVTSMYRVK